MTATATMTMGRRAEMSPKSKARLIGVLFLLTMVGGGFAQGFVAGKLISGDAAATAANILAHESLYRLAFAVYLIEMACQIAMTVLFYLGGADYLSVFDPKQLQALAFFSLRVNYTVETIAMVFFGLNTILTGYLVFRSTFLPRALGVVSVIGGLGWMIYLYEPLAHRLEAYIVGVGVLGALASVLWLLVKGVDEARWKELAYKENTR